MLLNFVTNFEAVLVTNLWFYVSVSTDEFTEQVSKVTIVTGSSVLRTVWGIVWRIHSHGGATYTLFLHICGATVWVQKKLAFFTVCQFWAYFWRSLQISPQKSKCTHYPRTRRHLCAKFDVLRPSQSRDIVWRTVTHPDTQLMSPSVNLSPLHWGILLLLGHIECMKCDYCDRWSWASVSLSVMCLRCANIAARIQVLFRVEILGDPPHIQCHLCQITLTTRYYYIKKNQSVDIHEKTYKATISHYKTNR